MSDDVKVQQKTEKPQLPKGWTWELIVHPLYRVHPIYSNPALRKILDKGVDPNDLDYTGQSALDAFLCGKENGQDPSTLELLITHGADLSQKCKIGDLKEMTYLEAALSMVKGAPEVLSRHGLVDLKKIRIPLPHNKTWSTVFASFDTYRPSIIKILESGIDLNLPDKNKQSIWDSFLRHEVISTDPDIVRTMLANGADPKEGFLRALQAENIFAVHDILEFAPRETISTLIPDAIKLVSDNHKVPVAILELLIATVIDWQCPSKDLLSLSDLHKIADHLGFTYTTDEQFCEKMASLLGTFSGDCKYVYRENPLEISDRQLINDHKMRDHSVDEIRKRTLVFAENPSGECQISITQSSELPTYDVYALDHTATKFIKFAAKYDAEGKPIIVLGPNVHHHSNIFGHKQKVAMAGHIIFRNNKIFYIDNDSGHFQFPQTELECFVQKLRKFYPNCLTKDFYYSQSRW